MNWYQFLSVLIAAFCVVYGLKIWISALPEKDDAMYGQSVMSAIWMFSLAFIALTRAFG